MTLLCYDNASLDARFWRYQRMEIQWKNTKAHHGIKIRKWSNVNTGTQFHASFIKRNSFSFPCWMNFRCFLFLFFKKEVLLSCEKRTFFNFFKQTTKVMEIPSYTHIISRTLWVPYGKYFEVWLNMTLR